jgi:hypothetical protein
MGQDVNTRILVTLALPAAVAGLFALSACNDKDDDVPVAPATIVSVSPSPVYVPSASPYASPSASKSVKVVPSASVSVSVSPSDKVKNDVPGDGGE